ncbi:MAG: hypothetical protein ABEI57_07645 [Halapricum sp.]
MAIQKLRELDRTSAGVTLPKDDLKLEGLIDSDGSVVDCPVKVEKTDEATWEITVLDPDDYPAVSG